MDRPVFTVWFQRWLSAVPQTSTKPIGFLHCGKTVEKLLWIGTQTFHQELSYTLCWAPDKLQIKVIYSMCFSVLTRTAAFHAGFRTPADEIVLCYKNIWLTSAHLLSLQASTHTNTHIGKLPVAKAIPKHVVNPVMARMSSKLPAAISKVGMPCSTP